MAQSLPNQPLSPRELADIAAKNVVKAWEAAEDTATQLCLRYGLFDDARERMIADMRGMIGGEEIYLAAKEYLRCS